MPENSNCFLFPWYVCIFLIFTCLLLLVPKWRIYVDGGNMNLYCLEVGTQWCILYLVMLREIFNLMCDQEINFIHGMGLLHSWKVTTLLSHQVPKMALQVTFLPQPKNGQQQPPLFIWIRILVQLGCCNTASVFGQGIKLPFSLF